MYVKYYALPEAQLKLLKLLMRRSLLALGVLLVMLVAVITSFGLPYGLEPAGWPISPVNWYGWGLAFLLVLIALAGMVLIYAFRQLYIDWKVRQNSPGISGVAYPLAVLAFGLLAFAVILVGKLLFTLAWTLPTGGWPTGIVATQSSGERIRQVGFDMDGIVFHVMVKSGRVRTWILGRVKESPSRTEYANNFGPVSSPPLASLDGPSFTLVSRDTVAEVKKDRNRISLLRGPGGKDRTLIGDIHPVSSFALSEVGLLLLAGYADGSIRTWKLDEGENKGKLLGTQEGPVPALACSGDEQRAISGGQDNTARIWDLAARKEIAVLEGGHPSPVKHVALNRDGKRALTISEGPNLLCVWDVESRRLLAQWSDWRTSGNQLQLALSPNGRYALTASGDDWQLWQLP